MPGSADSRLRRPAPSRRCGPRRRTPPATVQGPGPGSGGLAYELWNLRAIWPDACADDLLALKRRQDALLAREREALAGLWSGERVILAPGHGFFEANPDLGRGVTVSLHQGPYQLLAEPFLAAGLSPLIVLNGPALASFRPHAEALVSRLGHRGAVQWASLSERGFVRRMVRAVKQGQPVLVYLDGNSGRDGMTGTRDRGLDYRLPGRRIRVRTGLARLVCRLGCPVHRVALAWGEDGLPVWEREPSAAYGRDADPGAVTAELYDWCFSQVMRRPHQWHYWAMLRESSACFGSAGLDRRGVPAGLREDFRRAFATCLEKSPGTVRLVLENEVEIWSGGILADLSEDRFYPAAGLQDGDLDPLREGRPTLAELVDHHGRSWVAFHGLRLCLLGMARLGG